MGPEEFRPDSWSPHWGHEAPALSLFVTLKTIIVALLRILVVILPLSEISADRRHSLVRVRKVLNVFVVREPRLLVPNSFLQHGQDDLQCKNDEPASSGIPKILRILIVSLLW